MTKEMARRAADAGLANVGVSIDGLETTHEAIRGLGTYRRAVRGIERLEAAGVATGVVTHLNRTNLLELEALHDEVLALGARSWKVQLGKPMGNLASHPDALLRPRDLLSVMPRLARLKRRSTLWIDLGDSLGYHGPEDRFLRSQAWRAKGSAWTGCQAGRYAIGIEADGGVKGCLSLQMPLASGQPDPFREGDLRTRRLADLWFDPRAFAWNRSPAPLTGACARCEHAATCRGGAKCVAAAFTGGLTENPYCHHRVLAEAGRGGGLIAPLRRAAAAAAISLALGGASLTGCLDRPLQDRNDAAQVVTDPDGGQDASDPCANVCCECDYGLPPPGCCGTPADAGVAPDAAPAPDAGDPCANVCCECDYGLPPPGCCGTPDAGVVPDAAPPGDAGVSCEGVCCDCDYGLPPPPECCP
jgi:MoaA/NifB/PqqE/SkfB family radical SAM enzyme